MFESLSGVWTRVESDWKLVKSSIDQKKPELETQELKTAIEKVFEETPEKNFPKEKVSDIQKMLKKASAWAHAKEVGKIFIPSGDSTRAFERIQVMFKEKGLFIVEVGELEGFAKSIGNHGPKWVNEVITKNLKEDPELETARQFVRQF